MKRGRNVPEEELLQQLTTGQGPASYPSDAHHAAGGSMLGGPQEARASAAMAAKHDYSIPHAVALLTIRSTDADNAAELASDLLKEELAVQQLMGQREAGFIKERYSFSQWLEHKNQEAAIRLSEEAAAYAESHGQNARVADYGGIACRATAAAAHGGGEEEQPASSYTGRPLQGYTSGALYVSAEQETGFPPHKRDKWKYPLGAEEGSGSSTVTSTLLGTAYDQLKRPSFPDRGYALSVASGGSAMQRELALAAEYEAAAQEAELLLASRSAAALAAVRGLQGGGSGSGSTLAFTAAAHPSSSLPAAAHGAATLPSSSSAAASASSSSAAVAAAPSQGGAAANNTVAFGSTSSLQPQGEAMAVEQG